MAGGRGRGRHPTQRSRRQIEGGSALLIKLETHLLAIRRQDESAATPHGDMLDHRSAPMHSKSLMKIGTGSVT